MARVLDCRSRSCGFESHRLRQQGRDCSRMVKIPGFHPSNHEFDSRQPHFKKEEIND